jgi:hypothetical protein
MAWKGDGSGRKDSPRGGVSGGGLAGGRQGGNSGGFSSGMLGSTARRSPVSSPSYEASLGNLAKMAGTMVPGAGLFNGVRGLMTGQFGPSYSGYQGQVNTPGFADPTNRALTADGGQPMTRTQGAGLYRGAGALTTPGMLGAQQPQAPAPVPIAPQQIAPQSQIGKYLSTPGLMAYGVNSPGYKYF